MKNISNWSNHSELSIKEEFLPINEVGTYLVSNDLSSEHGFHLSFT